MENELIQHDAAMVVRMLHFVVEVYGAYGVISHVLSVALGCLLILVLLRFRDMLAAHLTYTGKLLKAVYYYVRGYGTRRRMRMEREKWLKEKAEDFITDGFEDQEHLGKVSTDEKHWVYRYLSRRLSGLVACVEDDLKDAISKRLHLKNKTVSKDEKGNIIPRNVAQIPFPDGPKEEPAKGFALFKLRRAR